MFGLDVVSLSPDQDIPSELNRAQSRVRFVTNWLKATRRRVKLKC